MTAHNVVLSYLAEAGIIGVCALCIFLLNSLYVGLIIYKKSIIKTDLQLAIPLLVIMFFIFISSFYAGSWFWSINGVQFMFFLALANIIYLKKND